MPNNGNELEPTLKSMGKDPITPIVVMEKPVRDMKFGLVERGDLIFKV